MFIGSSAEAIDFANHLHVSLQREVEVTVWKDGVFGQGEGTLASLVKATKNFRYAALILNPDDTVIKRGESAPTARDNVIFELGMFIGALGPERTFIVHSHDEKLNLPSDLAGVTTITYSKRSDGNFEAEVNPVATIIKARIKKLESHPAST